MKLYLILSLLIFTSRYLFTVFLGCGELTDADNQVSDGCKALGVSFRKISDLSTVINAAVENIEEVQCCVNNTLCYQKSSAGSISNIPGQL